MNKWSYNDRINSWLDFCDLDLIFQYTVILTVSGLHDIMNWLADFDQICMDMKMPN